MRTPTWEQVERFYRIDGWREIRRTGHVHFEKALPGGRVLRTHRCFSSKKTMSPGRFQALLRYQIDVSEEQFWRALETREPVDG